MEAGMPEHREIEDMIEILTIAIIRQETEEQFFRRSAHASTSEVAKALFLEIADDLKRYCENLEMRKRKLVGALADLVNSERRNLGTEPGQADEAAIQRDPVCGMEINKDTCPFTSTHSGREYRFCSADCQRAFELAPEKYIEE
jgi:YHS domain-containing protein/histone H3/H4